MTSNSPAGGAAQYARFNVKPYQADDGFSGSGLMMLLTTMLIAGAIIGFVAHFISQFFYLILLFPILIGLALGAIGSRAAKWANLRNPLLGGLAGFIGGAAAMLMMHYFDYQHFRSQLAEAAPDIVEVSQMSPQEQQQILPEFENPQAARRILRAYSSFLGYMQFQAEEGVEIKRAASGSKERGLNLGQVGTYIYWIIELLIVAGITFAAVKKQASLPFCADCSTWKQFKVLGMLKGDQSKALEGVKSGDVAAIAASEPSADEGSIVLSAACCDNCNTWADLHLDSLSKDSKGNIKRTTLTQVCWPAEALPVLESLFAPAAASPQTGAPVKS